MCRANATGSIFKMKYFSSGCSKDYGKRPAVYTAGYDKQVIAYWISV